MAERSEANARSLWVLQLLALFFLPLSLSTVGPTFYLTSIYLANNTAERLWNGVLHHPG